VESANAVAVVESTQIVLKVRGAVESEPGSLAPPKKSRIRRSENAGLNPAYLMNQKVIVGRPTHMGIPRSGIDPGGPTW
jgi:hypothetical protein